MKYAIQTEHGHIYFIDENYCITSENWTKPSMDWQLCCLRRVKPFGHVGLPLSIEIVLSEHPDGNLRFKNGRGKYVVQDYDHGTQRIWSDRVVAIWEVK